MIVDLPPSPIPAARTSQASTGPLSRLCSKKPRTKKIMIHEQEDHDSRLTRTTSQIANPIDLVPGFGYCCLVEFESFGLLYLWFHLITSL
jgi:hypothetical protein